MIPYPPPVFLAPISALVRGPVRGAFFAALLAVPAFAETQAGKPALPYSMRMLDAIETGQIDPVELEKRMAELKKKADAEAATNPPPPVVEAAVPAELPAAPPADFQDIPLGSLSISADTAHKDVKEKLDFLADRKVDTYAPKSAPTPAQALPEAEGIGLILEPTRGF